jgi:hypothetical protein
VAAQPEDRVEPGFLVKAGSVIAGTATGLLSVPSNATAGTVLGLLRGAGVKDAKALQRAFKWTYWTTSLAIGVALGGPIGGPIALAIHGGAGLAANALAWRLQGNDAHTAVRGGIEKTTDAVTFHANDRPTNSVARRGANALLGALAGPFAGAWSGFKINYQHGKSLLVDAFREARENVGHLLSPQEDKVDIALQEDDYKNVTRDEALRYLGWFTSQQQDTGFPWKLYRDDTDNLNFDKRKPLSDFEALDRLTNGEEVLFQQARGIPLGFTPPKLSAAALIPGLPDTSKLLANAADASQASASIKAGNVDWNFGAPVAIRILPELKLLFQMYNPDAHIQGDVGEAAKLLAFFTYKTLNTPYPWKFYEVTAHRLGPVNFDTRHEVSPLSALRNVLADKPVVFQKKKQHSADLTIPFIGANFGNLTWYSDSGKGSQVVGVEGPTGLKNFANMEDPDKLKAQDKPKEDDTPHLIISP